MLGNQISVKKYISREVAANSLSGKLASRWQSQTDELNKETEGVEETGRIFVRNLSYTAVEEDLRTEFEKFGPVTEVHLPVDRITRQSKGFAFVSFLLPEHAAKAFEALDGTTFQGRMLHLLPSKAKDEMMSSDGVKAGSSFKREKELKMKKAAGTKFICQRIIK
jgi:multiple RNA-binding domain-containing protein 1